VRLDFKYKFMKTKTFELKRYKSVKSKKGEIVGYFETLEEAEIEACKLRLYSICEYTKVTDDGIIRHSFDQYYFKNF
jgi:hypothetical protein